LGQAEPQREQQRTVFATTEEQTQQLIRDFLEAREKDAQALGLGV